MNAFWSNGYGGTSLADLLDATGLSRGSLYAAFGDKRGIFLLALDRYIDDALARFDRELAPGRDAVKGLRDCLAGYLDRTSGAAGRRGCLVVATAMELAGQDAEVEARLGRFFASAQGKLARAVARAAVEQGVVDAIDPESAARILLSTVEGMRVIAKTGIDHGVWQATIDSLLSRLLT